MILFRCAPSGVPFLWEHGDAQPAARWHARDAGPAHYLADTPDGAWAEVIRHFEITDPVDLQGLRHTLWAVEVPDGVHAVRPRVDGRTATGGPETYDACRAEAARLRARGATAIRAPSAALRAGAARGWRVENGIRRGPDRDGETLVLFGPRTDLVAWRAAVEGRPDPALIGKVRQFR